MTKILQCLLTALVVVLCVSGIARAQPADAPLDQSSTRGSLPLRNSIAQDLHGILLIDPKIVGGLYTKAGDDPWQVALIRADKTGADRRPFCGGSLISAVWVVTAAHCVDNNTLHSDLDVLGGTVDVGVGGIRANVAEIFVHPDYVPGTYPRNDIALLRLSSILSGPAIDAIPLVSPTNEAIALKDGALARVTGWGSLGEGGTPVRDLRYVQLRVFTNTDCNDPVAYNEKVKDEMVCAGFVKGGKDSCQGDSGGPLTVTLEGEPQLVGIVSWGEGCAKPNRYGVYTRAPRFVEWIADCQAQKPTCRKPLASASGTPVALVSPDRR